MGRRKYITHARVPVYSGRVSETERQRMTRETKKRERNGEIERERKKDLKYKRAPQWVEGNILRTHASLFRVSD